MTRESLTWHQRRTGECAEYSLRCGSTHVATLFRSYSGLWRISFSYAHFLLLRSKGTAAAQREAVRLVVKRAEAERARAQRILRAAGKE